MGNLGFIFKFTWTYKLQLNYLVMPVSFIFMSSEGFLMERNFGLSGNNFGGIERVIFKTFGITVTWLGVEKIKF